MSNPGETPEAEPTLIEQAGAVPETVIPADALDPVPEPEASETPETKTKAAEPERPKQKPWFQQRIDELTRQKGEEKRAREAAEARATALEAAKKADAETEAPPSQFTQEAFRKAVEAEAVKLSQQQQTNARAQTWLKAGVSEFGMAEFNERCALVASLGADERPEFMQLVTDPDIIPDGHKVVAMLADHPEEAQAILGERDPVRMAARLTRFATQAKPEPKAISGAPRPITPIGGSAKASSAPSESDPIDVWMAKRNAEVTARRDGKAH